MVSNTVADRIGYKVSTAQTVVKKFRIEPQGLPR